MRSFAQLFAGRTDCYAFYRVNGQLKGKKVDGKGDTKREPLPTDAYEQHLAGEYMLGIVPIQLDGTVVWFAGDIDDYNIDIVALDKECQRLEIPVVVCRTKSGGAHVYCFVNGAIKGSDAIRLMRQWVTLLGYPKSEIFPKQVVVTEDSVGNWINLPYYHADKTDRYAIGINGERLSLQEFIQLAEARSIRPREVAGLLKALKEPAKDKEDQFKHAPPCIQQMSADLVQSGGRNNALTHWGVYYRLAYPDDWENRVRDASSEYFSPALDNEEVTQVIKNLRSGKYQYLCKVEPMCSLCNKDVCLTRKWGVGPQRGTDYGDIKFGDLTMLMSDPPVWIWVVNGQPVTMSTDQLTSPSKFRNRLVDVLGILPPKIKGSEHERMVADAMRTMTKEEAPPEVSLAGMVLDMFKEWVASNAPRAHKIGDILKGLPYFDKDSNMLIFRGQDFTLFFHRESKHNYSTRDIWSAIRKNGGSLDNRRVQAEELGSDNQMKLWHVPVDKPWFKLPGQERF